MDLWVSLSELFYFKNWESQKSYYIKKNITEEIYYDKTLDTPHLMKEGFVMVGTMLTFSLFCLIFFMHIHCQNNVFP